jgi:hypothetical protein
MVVRRSIFCAAAVGDDHVHLVVKERTDVAAETIPFLSVRCRAHFLRRDAHSNVTAERQSHPRRGRIRMADMQGEPTGDRPGAQPTPEPGESFPTNAVVGIIDDPRELLQAAGDLRSAGFEPEVLCGERGVNRIESAGGSARDVRLTRAVQGLFGYEADHSDRHTKALEQGNFVVLVGSSDDETTDRIRDVFATHGGHFVNYYSKWTGRSLIP